MLLEKGKEVTIRKLRNNALIKGGMKISMRIALNFDKDKLIEKDSRFSTANFGS